MTTSPDPAPPTLRPVQRVAAYAVVRRGERALLVRASPTSLFAGRWGLPGGSLRHGEPPREAVRRSTLAETGVQIEVGDVLGVDSEVADLPHEGLRLHTLRVFYDVRRADGEAQVGRSVAAGVDRAEFVSSSEAAGLTLMPHVARNLGLVPSEPPEVLGGVVPSFSVPAEFVVGMPDPGRTLRPAAYAVVVEEGRLLLSRLAGGSRRWTLPGGGIDFGEDPADAVRRELYEETALPFTPGRLIDVDSVHFTGRSWSGRKEDQHAVRFVYDGTVPPGLTPHVTEVDGSTEESAWISLDEIRHTPRTEMVDAALRHLPD